MMRNLAANWFAGCAFGLLVLGCAKSGLSDRDTKREEIRSSAETKRKELELVAGDYQGALSQTSGVEQNVSLRLEIKDIPQPVEGQIDPVITPILTGFLRFNLGQDANEYIGFGVQKAEFDPKSGKLDLIVTNTEYKDLIISLKRENQALLGSWTAPGIAVSGSLRLNKGSVFPSIGESLQGEYGGYLFRSADGIYQYGHLTLRTVFQPPEGLRVSATVRLIFGAWGSSEYLTYRFEQAQFNPITGQLSLKGDGLDVVLVGHLSRGKLKGEWASNYTGKMGAMEFAKGLIPSPRPAGALYDSLRGKYRGLLVNTNPDSNLSSRLMMSFVTSQDLTQPGGVKVTGSFRTYLGEFDSGEFVEIPFNDVQVNFFTGKVVAKTSGDYKLTFKGDIGDRKVSGVIYSDALAELATFEVNKL